MHIESSSNLLIIGFLLIAYIIPLILCLMYSVIIIVEDLFNIDKLSVNLYEALFIFIVDIFIAFIPILNFKIGYHLYNVSPSYHINKNRDLT